MSIRLYTDTDLDTLRWRASYGDAATERYLRALVSSHPSHYIDNVAEDMALMTVDEKHLIPLVINHGRSRNCYVTSCTAHFVDYAADAVSAKLKSRLKRLGVAALLALIRLAFKAAAIDRAVHINCWLLPTGKTAAVTPGELERITACLTRRYPGYALIYKGIVPQDQGRPGLSDFGAAGYRPVMSRLVYLWEPVKQTLAKRDVKRAFALLGKTGYELAGNDALEPHHIDRMCKLYRALYEDKHSRFSIRYNQKWFSLVNDSGFLAILAFIDNGRLDGCSCLFSDRDAYVSSLAVFDQDENTRQKGGLYNLSFAVAAALARETGKYINLSSGGDTFKRNRGAVGVFEHDAVFFSHLSARARLVWAGFIALYNSVGRKIHAEMVGV